MGIFRFEVLRDFGLPFRTEPVIVILEGVAVDLRNSGDALCFGRTGHTETREGAGCWVLGAWVPGCLGAWVLGAGCVAPSTQHAAPGTRHPAPGTRHPAPVWRRQR